MSDRDVPMRQLGLEIQLARLGASLGVRELARRADISSHSRISEMEAGRRVLTDEELGRIYHALGLSTGEQERLTALAEQARRPLAARRTQRRVTASIR